MFGSRKSIDLTGGHGAGHRLAKMLRWAAVAVHCRDACRPGVPLPLGQPAVGRSKLTKLTVRRGCRGLRRRRGDSATSGGSGAARTRCRYRAGSGEDALFAGVQRAQGGGVTGEAAGGDAVWARTRFIGQGRPRNDRAGQRGGRFAPRVRHSGIHQSRSAIRIAGAAKAGRYSAPIVCNWRPSSERRPRPAPVSRR